MLAARSEIGAIFTARRYGEVAGALPMPALRLEYAAGPAPDLVVSYAWNADARIHDVPGTVFSNQSGNRGTHGTLSPRDIHNVLFAAGPGFRSGFRDPLPSANVDVAPTIAMILGVALPQAAGRPLREVLRSDGAVDATDYRIVERRVEAAEPARDLVVSGLGTPSSSRTFRSGVAARDVCLGDRCWRYFDHGLDPRRRDPGHFAAPARLPYNSQFAF
jgi:hypothetical protein